MFNRTYHAEDHDCRVRHVTVLAARDSRGLYAYRHRMIIGLEIKRILNPNELELVLVLRTMKYRSSPQRFFHVAQFPAELIGK